MEISDLYKKNKKIECVDKLIKAGASFEIIKQVTGWTDEELWNYIDMVYRKENKEEVQDENNKSYFCWGETPKSKK